MRAEMDTYAINRMYEIKAAAEREIMADTGVSVTLVVIPCDNRINLTEMGLLNEVVKALQMPFESYLVRTRKRECVELRFIAAKLMKIYFPQVSLKEIGRMFGGYDHTSIMNCIQKANDLLEIKDEDFTGRYNKALKALEQWVLRPTL